MNTIFEAVRKDAYPGRGIMAGKSPDGRLFLAYFIMGRSANSRNRIFAPDGGGLRTQAHDPALLTDPSLIIYAPVRTVQDHIIITNGDQTDTIAEALLSGKSFESALRARAFEPDAPNFTPRISAIIAPDGSLKMALLKTQDAGQSCCRFFYEYERMEPGVAHFLHTYRGDGNPLPPFAGEPERVSLPNGDLADALWRALDKDNRVALWVRRGAQTRIINALEESPCEK